MKKRIATLLAAAVLLCCCAGCGGAEQDIRKLNKRFCHAYNRLDAEELMDCLEPRTAKMLSALEGLAGGVISDMVGMDLDAELLRDLALGCYDFMPDEYKQGMEMPELEIETHEVELNEEGDEAAASVTLTVTMGDDSETEDGVLYYTLIDDEWYLSNENFKGMS